MLDRKRLKACTCPAERLTHMLRAGVALAALAATCGVGVTDAVGQEELVIANVSGNSVTTYLRTASGDTAPRRTLSGAATGLAGPLGIVQDLVHGELIVANNRGVSVSVYDRLAAGDARPLRSITGFSFGPISVAVDLVHDELVVLGLSQMLVYPRPASGPAHPVRTLAGAATGLSGASSVYLDLIHDEVFVANRNNHTITVYPRTASGNTPPIRTIHGDLTELNGPTGIAADLSRDELFVTNQQSHSIGVYQRTASGNVAPLRTLQGAATGLNFPVGLAVDLVHGELLVPIFTGAVAVFDRRASGNAAPTRVLTGPSTGLNAPEFVAFSTAPPLAAAILPLSRSHQVGTLLTAFATILNVGAGPAQQCLVMPPPNAPAGVGAFVFQTTDPLTNVPTGLPNRPANVEANGQQTVVFGFTPVAPVAETRLAMMFVCESAAPVPATPGVTDLTLVADANPVPDPIALVATVKNDGVVRIPAATGTGLFGVGTANVGATGTVAVSAGTGGKALPLALSVCETDSTGGCSGATASSVTVEFAAGTTRSFAFFAAASGSIPFDPAVNRIFVAIRDATGTIRGSTSTAVCTTPNDGC